MSKAPRRCLVPRVHRTTPVARIPHRPRRPRETDIWGRGSLRSWPWAIRSRAPTFNGRCRARPRAHSPALFPRRAREAWASSIEGSASGQLDGNTVTVTATGKATLSGAFCDFSLSGTGTIAGDALTIPYTGHTCLGPVEGTEVLRRPGAPGQPAPPPPPPGANPNHVGPGPLSVDRASEVVFATGNEFPGLTAVFPSDEQAVAAAEELLRRTIWHLQLAGYQAARQRNPSGAISNDKLCIFIDGRWHAFDIFRLGFAGSATRVQFLEITGENPVADGGIPD